MLLLALVVQWLVSLLLTQKVMPSRIFITLETGTQLQSIRISKLLSKKLERKAQGNTKKGPSLNVVWGVCSRFQVHVLGAWSQCGGS